VDVCRTVLSPPFVSPLVVDLFFPRFLASFRSLCELTNPPVLRRPVLRRFDSPFCTSRFSVPLRFFALVEFWFIVSLSPPFPPLTIWLMISPCTFFTSGCTPPYVFCPRVCPHSELNFFLWCAYPIFPCRIGVASPSFSFLLGLILLRFEVDPLFPPYLSAPFQDALSLPVSVFQTAVFPLSFFSENSCRSSKFFFLVITSFFLDLNAF